MVDTDVKEKTSEVFQTSEVWRGDAVAGALHWVAQPLWRAVASPYTTILLLTLLLLFALCGALVPQVDAAVQQDPLRYEQWLNRLRAQWGGVAEFAEAAGLFGVYRSLLWRLLLSLVGGCCFLRLLYCWWPGWVGSPQGRLSAWSFSLLGSAETTWSTIQRALALVDIGIAARPYSIRRGEGEAVRCALGRQIGLPKWFPGLLYLGVLILLVGALVGQQFGWRGEPVDLVLGEARSLGGQSQTSIRLDAVEIVPRPDGSIAAVNSFLFLVQGTTETEITVNKGDKAAVGGLAVWQEGYGPAVRVTVRDGGGRSLDLVRVAATAGADGLVVAPVQRLSFSEQQQEQLLAVPRAGLSLRLLHYPTLPGQGISGRALHVQAYDGASGRLEDERFLSGDQEMRVGELTFGFRFEYFVTVRAQEQPETPLMLLGGLLVVLGLAGQVAFPAREAWVVVASTAQTSVCRLEVLAGDTHKPWYRCVRAVLGEESSGGALDVPIAGD